AADTGFLNVLKSLLEAKSACTDRESQIQEALSVAMIRGQVQVVQYLLDQAPVDPEIVSWHLSESSKEIVELVVKKVSPTKAKGGYAKQIILALLKLQ